MSGGGKFDATTGCRLRFTTGGVMISDNLFAGGRMLDPRFLVIRRDRTIHENLRRFLDSVLAADELQSMVVPAGDGLLISRKKEKDE